MCGSPSNPAASTRSACAGNIPLSSASSCHDVEQGFEPGPFRWQRPENPERHAGQGDDQRDRDGFRDMLFDRAGGVLPDT
jgi:hypothetical protein